MAARKAALVAIANSRLIALDDTGERELRALLFTRGAAQHTSTAPRKMPS